MQEAPHKVQARMALAWLTAARVGCVMQLTTRDVLLNPQGDLTVHFRRGKGVKLRGPYTVHSKCPAKWQELLRETLAQAKDGWLFPCNSLKDRQEQGREVTAALRKVDKTLEQRSIRRGSLQAMASDAATEEATLLHFSGHTNLPMLRRYLEWGRRGEKRAQESRRAAEALQRGLQC
jgi:hypothetical protein